MFQTCPKCAHERKEHETTSPGTCPACGLIFAKYVEVQARTTAQRDAARTGRTANGGDTNSRGNHRPEKNFLKLGLSLTVVATLLFWFSLHRGHRIRDVKALPVASVTRGAANIQQREFSELFDNDTALGDLAKAGQYTIVEVYLDECTYCRELESAMVPFREKRQDVALIRVHHSGHMNASVNGATREEVQKKMDQLSAKMTSYGLCGTPHVEVYGPDRRALGVDRCGDGSGTAFLWDWMGAETGIKRRSAYGALTGF